REALDLDAAPLPREQHAVLLEVRGEPDGFLGRGGGDHGLRAVGERGHDRRGRAQHVDHDDATAPEIARAEAEGGEIDVDLHAGWSSCGSRSRNLVSTRPATNSAWRMTRLRKGMVVVT